MLHKTIAISKWWSLSSVQRHIKIRFATRILRKRVASKDDIGVPKYTSRLPVIGVVDSILFHLVPIRRQRGWINYHLAQCLPEHDCYRKYRFRLGCLTGGSGKFFQNIVAEMLKSEGNECTMNSVVRGIRAELGGRLRRLKCSRETDGESILLFCFTQNRKKGPTECIPTVLLAIKLVQRIKRFFFFAGGKRWA